ncbi:MAG: hypothetical protein V2A53_02390 [bacterium]
MLIKILIYIFVKIREGGGVYYKKRMLGEIWVENDEVRKYKRTRRR